MREAGGKSAAELARENEELRYRLEEAEEVIEAVRTGAVDALAIQGPEGPRIFTLEGADHSYRTLIEQMNEGALLLGADATVLYGNACLAGLLGAPLQELIGASFAGFVPDEFQAYWAALVAAGWRGKSKGEMPLRSQAGLLRPFALALNVLDFHEAPTLAVIVTDVSAQREISVIQARVAAQNALLDRKNQELQAQSVARRAVEQAAAETSRILEGIPHIAWTADARGANTYLNQRWFDYTGQQPGEADLTLVGELLHPDDREPATARWNLSLQTEQPLEVECRIRNAAGGYRWMLGRALPSRNEQGEIMQWIGTYTDIHEHKLALARIDQAQRELQRNNEQLTRANVDLDNFIYTASHDLKAPISNIEGLLHALLLELPAPTEAEAGNDQVPLIMHMMQDSVDRFKRTIEHLTEVTKLQKEHGHSAATVDLDRLIQEVQLDLGPLEQATGAALEMDVQSCPTISFSEKNLRSIIYNLLSNALKYCAPDRSPRVRIWCRTEGDYAVLRVQDNGLGLNLSQDGPKLFAMFQRLHAHVEGTGIGLYMVKKIVENAGGRITVESQVGVGSTFSVYFRR